MAEAIAFTCLGTIGSFLMETIGGYLVDPLRQQLRYMCCFKNNMKELEAQLEEFQTIRQGVQLGVDNDRKKVRVIGPNVETWLKKANEVTCKVDGILQDKLKVKERCLNGWCPNLKMRYSLSKKAVENAKAVVELQKAGIRYTKSSYSPPATCVETIPNRDFMMFESRRLNMEEIIESLTDDDTNLIGIHGLAGVGKTKMVQEVRQRAKEEKLFDEVAFVAVGQYPDLTKVQNCIANIFGLANLGKYEDATTRASLLRKRLLQDKKKILLILDDIWSEFDLEDQGIPLEGSHETFKILYTSRFQGIWHNVPNKKEIALELLSEEEAWQLFREKTGDLVDAQDLKPIAKKIVHECGRLPLALVIIGGTLSKKSRGHFFKGIWEDMRDRLACPSRTLADKRLASSLELTYNNLEDDEAKRLFVLCCLSEEDEAICLEVLARYALGLSLFDGIYEMSRVRHRVLALVDDLKSRYLLLHDSYSDGHEHVKVHDVVHDMGISIACRDKGALVSHGPVSEWPKNGTYEHYTSISVISGTITELPEGLKCPDLEFLLLECKKIEKLPCDFFEGMGKLKVLELCNFCGILTLQSLRNLRTLSLYYYGSDVLHKVSGFGGLFNLEILSFCCSRIEELPEEIGELVNLRLLDLRETSSLDKIPPGVISRLVRLKELYIVHTKFRDWEEEGKEEEGRNANLREFESLSNFSTLEIEIRGDVLIPQVPIFSKLKTYNLTIGDTDDSIIPWRNHYNRRLRVSTSSPISLDHGGIDLLLRSSDCLFLGKEGCNDLVRELLLGDGVNGLLQLKILELSDCGTSKCLANTMTTVQQQPNTPAPVSAVFPILIVLNLFKLPKLRNICHGLVPVGSFRELTSIEVENCERLGNLFQLPIVGCLSQLKSLTIKSCDTMEEVIWKEQQEDVPVATNRIMFPKLEYLELEKLPSLVGFCRGIDQIDFPRMKCLELRDLGQFNRIFHNNSNMSSTSEPNDNVDFLSLFPQKVTFPSLEELKLEGLQNVSDILGSELPSSSFSKLQKLQIEDCESLEICSILPWPKFL